MNSKLMFISLMARPRKTSSFSLASETPNNRGDKRIIFILLDFCVFRIFSPSFKEFLPGQLFRNQEAGMLILIRHS